MRGTHPASQQSAEIFVQRDVIERATANPGSARLTSGSAFFLDITIAYSSAKFRSA
jgi:hypothetical protein